MRLFFQCSLPTIISRNALQAEAMREKKRPAGNPIFFRDGLFRTLSIDLSEETGVQVDLRGSFRKHFPVTEHITGIKR